MVRLRIIKKYGDSHAIKLEPADLKDLNLKVGDEVDIEDIIPKHDDEEMDKIMTDVIGGKYGKSD